MLNTQQIRNLYSNLYSKRATRYDFGWCPTYANLYYLIGIRMDAYRRAAVQALNLQPGDTVLELGCGTGLNFPHLQEAIGPEGKIIGVDLTPAMLAEAQERIQKHGWRNVELVQADASQFVFPQDVDGVFSSFALSIMPNHQDIIRKTAQALTEGGRLVTLDLKLTSGALSFLNPIGVLITKPFGGTYEAGWRKPWEEMRKHLADVRVQAFYFGFIYIASGTKLTEEGDSRGAE